MCLLGTGGGGKSGIVKNYVNDEHIDCYCIKSEAKVVMQLSSAIVGVYLFYDRHIDMQISAILTSTSS